MLKILFGTWSDLRCLRKYFFRRPLLRGQLSLRIWQKEGRVGRCSLEWKEHVRFGTAAALAWMPLFGCSPEADWQFRDLLMISQKRSEWRKCQALAVSYKRGQLPSFTASELDTGPHWYVRETLMTINSSLIVTLDRLIAFSWLLSFCQQKCVFVLCSEGSGRRERHSVLWERLHTGRITQGNCIDQKTEIPVSGISPCSHFDLRKKKTSGKHTLFNVMALLWSVVVERMRTNEISACACSEARRNPLDSSQRIVPFSSQVLWCDQISWQSPAMFGAFVPSVEKVNAIETWSGMRYEDTTQWNGIVEDNLACWVMSDGKRSPWDRCCASWLTFVGKNLGSEDFSIDSCLWPLG